MSVFPVSSAKLSGGPAGSADAAINRVVIIDDDSDFRDLLARMVRSAGLGAETHGATEFLAEKLAAGLPDLILLDLRLGRSDAIDVLDALGQMSFAGGVALMSGLGREALEDVRSVGLRNGLRMLSCLEKPIRRVRLERVLAEARLDRRQLPRPEPVSIDIGEALANAWLSVWYQPQFRIRNGAIYGLESLVRLNHPVRGAVAPDQFLPGMSVADRWRLTRFVIERTARDLLGFGQPPGMAMSVNLAVRDLQGGDLVELVRCAWVDQGVTAGLTIELTEDEGQFDIDMLNRMAWQLRLYRAGLSLDDFGAEQSSFHRLESVDFTELKLDRRYVSGAGHDERLAAVCRSTADLAHQFGLHAVAEGVESAADLDVVARAGFDAVQGFHLCRPMPAHDIAEAFGFLSRSN